MSRSEKQPLLSGSSQAPGYPPAQGQGGAPYPPAQGGSAPYPASAGQQPQQQQQPGAPPGAYQAASAPPAGQGIAPPSGGASAAGPAMENGQAVSPQMENMEKVSGYEGTGFHEDNFMAPPTYDAATAPVPQSAPDIHTNVARISEEEARAALLDFVSQHCCYGKGAARDMAISTIIPTNAFHYRLETFTENRRTAWKHTPFKGQPIDSCMNGVAPQAWQMDIPVGRMFEDRVLEMEVPHTAYVKPCHNCHARGYNRCHHCHARGYDVCNWCNGEGKKWCNGVDGGSGRFERCSTCHGTGRRSCSHCNGQGQLVCPVCRTYGSLKWYINLTVSWKNHIADHVVEAADLPGHLIVNAVGQLAMEEDYPRLAPLATFPDPNINAASARLVGDHARAFPLEMMHRQRHSVRIVPVSEAQFSHKNSTGRFWVYGHDRLVHAPDYPQQCCCGCTIL